MKVYIINQWNGTDAPSSVCNRFLWTRNRDGFYTTDNNNVTGFRDIADEYRRNLTNASLTFIME